MALVVSRGRLAAPITNLEAPTLSSCSVGGSSGSSADVSAPCGLIGPRRLSKRREKSEGHLSGVVTCVAEHLQSTSPTKSRSVGSRSRVSLKFPRPLESPAREQEESQQRPRAHSAEVPSCTNKADEIEDLRMQNVTLRKDLATLQQSVVESMKGDKAQFVGGGLFKTRTAAPSDASASRSKPPRGPTTAAAAQDADLEALRAALSERRAALRTAIEERDSALKDAQEARRQIGDLSQRNRTIAEQLEDCLSRLETTKEACTRAEEERNSLAGNAELLQTEIQQVRRDEASTRNELENALQQLEALRTELASSQTECASTAADRDSLRSKNADLEAQCTSMGVDMARLREELAAGGGQLERSMAHRKALAIARISSILNPEHSLKCSCFIAWSSLKTFQQQERLNEQIRGFEGQVEKLMADCNAATAARDQASAEAEQRRRAADDAQEYARSLEERISDEREKADLAEQRAADLAEQLGNRDKQLQETREQLSDESLADELHASRQQITAQEEELRRSRADAEDAVKQQQACLKDAADAAKKAEAAVREAALREAALRTELEAGKRAASKECVKELEQREASLRKELQEAEKVAKKATEAQAASKVELQKAEARIKELESQQRNVSTELTALRAASAQATQEAQAAQRRIQMAETRAQEAERRTNELQRNAANLQAQLDAADKKVDAADKKDAAEPALSAESMKAEIAKATQAASDEAKGLRCDKSVLCDQLSETRLSLAEARSNARSASEQLRQLKDEHKALNTALDKERAAHASAEECKQQGADFTEEARNALKEAKQSIRLMVTAPKVAVNLGNSNMMINVPFPFEAIRKAVQQDVMPQFAKVFAVDASIGDGQLKEDAQTLVQELAMSLQSKVYELMPQAEGTCNWDGFGSRCDKLGAA